MFTTNARLFATRLLKRFGFTIAPLHETWDHQRAAVISRCSPDFVFDVGANVGQWYQSFRDVNKHAVVFSFEPDPRAFLELRKLHTVVQDVNWHIFNKAVGANNGTSTMSLWDLAGGSSSLKELTKEGEAFTGQTQTNFETIEIEVCALDHFIQENAPEMANGFLKLDVQGFELEVLAGGSRALGKSIELVEIEVPFRPIYDGESNVETISALLGDHRFTPLTFQTKRWNDDVLAAADFDGMYRREASPLIT